MPTAVLRLKHSSAQMLLRGATIGRRDRLLEADLGIEKFSSYIVMQVPLLKHEIPIDRLFGEGRG